MTATEREAVSLPASVRCDRCGAQAYVEAVLPSSAVLVFCAHHYRESSVGLAAAGARVTSYVVPG